MNDSIDQQQKNMKALLSACQTVATEEGVTEENALITRTNEIYNDARLPQPLTEAGIKAQEKAIEILKANEEAEKNGIKSPYQQNGYDYEKHFNDIVPPSVSAMLKALAIYADELSIPSKSTRLTEDEQKTFEYAEERLSLDWFRILNDNNVPMSKYSDVISEMRDIISAIEGIMADQIAGHTREVLSRTYKALNPGNSLYDSSFATYQDLLDARLEIKTTQDAQDGSDRYNVEKTDTVEGME